MRSPIRTLSFLLTSSYCVLSANGQTMREMFSLNSPADVSGWQIVNDGVMGGRSSSQASLIRTSSGEQAMRFAGILSLANNGGFASVRSRPRGSLGLKADNSIVIRVRGDGRRYTFNLYTPDRRTAFSYQLEFVTTPGQWSEVRLPVNGFVAHSFGRRISGMALDPPRVHSVGILLGDKRPGTFELLVDWIRVD